ncbi:MAG: hypothetical protein Q8R26_01840 [bacterium]|nr:hypothetical protein [bacterium]
MRNLISVSQILLSISAVIVPTFFIYSYLAGFPSFWNAQFAWSIALIVCWIIVSIGYFHQGLLVGVDSFDHARSVSIALPIAVFFVQCILFVKGIFYGDWSLIFGALIVNSGVVFSLFRIIRARKSIF